MYTFYIVIIGTAGILGVGIGALCRMNAISHSRKTDDPKELKENTKRQYKVLIPAIILMLMFCAQIGLAIEGEIH